MQAYWTNCKRWFGGRVVRFDPDKDEDAFQIDFDDGETERGILGARVFRTRKKDYDFRWQEIDTDRPGLTTGATEQSAEAAGAGNNGSAEAPQPAKRSQKSSSRERSASPGLVKRRRSASSAADTSQDSESGSDSHLVPVTSVKPEALQEAVRSRLPSVQPAAGAQAEPKATSCFPELSYPIIRSRINFALV